MEAPSSNHDTTISNDDNNDNELTEMEWLEREQEKEMIKLAMERSLNEFHHSPQPVFNDDNRHHPMHSASEGNIRSPQNQAIHTSMPDTHHSYNDHHYASPGGGGRRAAPIANHGMDRHSFQQQQRHHDPPHHHRRDDEKFSPPRQDAMNRDTDFRRRPPDLYPTTHSNEGRYDSSRGRVTGGSTRNLGMGTPPLTREDRSPSTGIHRQLHRTGYQRGGSFRDVEEVTETVVDSPHHTYDRMGGPSTPLYHDRRVSPTGPLHHNYDYRVSPPTGAPYQRALTPPSNYGRRTPPNYQDAAQSPNMMTAPRAQARNAVLQTARQHLSKEEAELVDQALRLGRPTTRTSGHGNDRRSSSHGSLPQQQFRDTQHSGSSYGTRPGQGRSRSFDDIGMTQEEQRQLEEALHVSRTSANNNNNLQPPTLGAQVTMDLLSRAQASDHLTQEELDDIERALLENDWHHHSRRRGNQSHPYQEEHDHLRIPDEQRQIQQPPPASQQYRHSPPDSGHSRPSPSHYDTRYEDHLESSRQQQQQQHDGPSSPSRQHDHHRTFSGDSLAIAKADIQRAMAANQLSEEEYTELMTAFEANHGNNNGIHNRHNHLHNHLHNNSNDSPFRASARPRLHENRPVPGRTVSLDSINDRISDHSTNRIESERTLIASGSRYNGQQGRGANNNESAYDLAPPLEEPDLQPDDVYVKNEIEAGGSSRLETEGERTNRDAQELPDGQTEMVECSKPLPFSGEAEQETTQEQNGGQESPSIKEKERGQNESTLTPGAAPTSDDGGATLTEAVGGPESMRPPAGSKGSSSRPNSSHQGSRRSNPNNFSAALAALPYARGSAQGQGAPGSVSVDMEYSVSQFEDSVNTFGSDILGQPKGEESGGFLVSLETDTIMRGPSLSSGTVQGVRHLRPALGCLDDEAEDHDPEAMLDATLNVESRPSESSNSQTGSHESSKAGDRDFTEKTSERTRAEVSSCVSSGRLDTKGVHLESSERPAGGTVEQAGAECIDAQVAAIEISPNVLPTHLESVAADGALLTPDATPVENGSGAGPTSPVATPLRLPDEDRPPPLHLPDEDQPPVILNIGDAHPEEVGEGSDARLPGRGCPEQAALDFVRNQMPEEKQDFAFDQQHRQQEWRDHRGWGVSGDPQERFGEQQQRRRRDSRETFPEPHGGFDRWADRYGRDPRDDAEPLVVQRHSEVLRQPRLGHGDTRTESERDLHGQHRPDSHFGERNEPNPRGGSEPFVMQERLDEQLRKEPRARRSTSGAASPPVVPVQVQLEPRDSREAWESANNSVSSLGESTQYSLFSGHPPPTYRKQDSFRNTEDYERALYEHSNWRQSNPTPKPASIHETSGHRLESNPSTSEHTTSTWQHQQQPMRYTQEGDRVLGHDEFDEGRGRMHPNEYTQERDRMSDHDRFDDGRDRARVEEHSQEIYRDTEHDRFDADLKRALFESIQMHRNSLPDDEYVQEAPDRAGDVPEAQLSQHQIDHINRALAVPGEEENDALRSSNFDSVGRSRSESDGYALAMRVGSDPSRIDVSDQPLPLNQAEMPIPSEYMVPDLLATADAAVERALQEAKDEEERKSILLARQLQEEDERRASLLARYQANMHPQESTGRSPNQQRIGAFGSTSPTRELHPLEAEVGANASAVRSASIRDLNASLGQRGGPAEISHRPLEGSFSSLPQRRSSQVGAVRSSSPDRARHPLEDSFASLPPLRSSQAGAMHSTSPMRIRHPLEDSFSSRANERSQTNLRQSLEESYTSRLSSRSNLQTMDESHNSHISGRRNRTLDHARRSHEDSSSSQLAADDLDGSALSTGGEVQKQGKLTILPQSNLKESPAAAGERKPRRDSKVLAWLGKKGVSSLMQTMKRSSVRLAAGNNSATAGASADQGDGAIASEDLTAETLMQIDRAVSKGIISQLKGVVKYGDESTLFHADGGPESGGFDVAVKVYKRARGLGSNQANSSQKDLSQFRNMCSSEQLELWTIKEYRNLKRAKKAGVSAPAALMARQNILFMQFMGEDGRPAPQLGQLELRRGNKRWKILYKQIIEAIGRYV